MEKIILVQLGTSEANQIKRLADNKKISVCSVGKNELEKTINEIVMEKSKMPFTESFIPGNEKSMMVFCDVSEKHLDKLLFEMRQKGIQVDFKAVMTKTNRSWTLNRLYQELQREKEAL